SHAMVGQCGEAREQAAAALESVRDNFTMERATRTLATCDAANEVANLSAELARRFPKAALTSRIHLPEAGAARAFGRGDPARTIALLDPVRPYDRAPASEYWPAYLRGQAYLQLKDGAAARAQFENILAHPGNAPTSPLYRLAGLGIARAAVLAGD